MWIWLQKDRVKSRVMVKICSVLAVIDVHLLECDVVPWVCKMLHWRKLTEGSLHFFVLFL